MIRGQSSDQLLLPVNPLFLWLSLLAALAVNLLPLGRRAAQCGSLSAAH
jgi:rod shape-determining protein MreD